MITYKFFMDNFGQGEQEAKKNFALIAESKFSSIRGIVRLFDSTLLQKIKFYQDEFGFSLNEILAEPRLLNYDTTTELSPEEISTGEIDENKKTCVRAKALFIKNVLGFSNEQIRTYSLFSYETETLKQKIAVLKKHFGLEVSHIQSAPSLLNYDINTLLEKAEFYKKKLGYTSKQFKDFPNILTYDCDENSTDPKSAIKKIEFFLDELGLTESNLRAYPALLSLDTASNDSKEKSVRFKIKTYGELLGFTKRQFQKNPNLLNYDCISGPEDPSSVRGKISFYQKHLGLKPKHFQSDPGVFSYDCSDNGSPTSVLKKLEFYQNTLGLTPEHIRENLVLLHFDVNPESQSPTAVSKKLAAIYKIGLTNENIQANPRILASPAEDLEEKYILWSTIFPDKRYMNLATWFITRPEKIYARYRYLTDDLHHTGIRPNHLDHCESQFIKRFKSNSQVLMDKYPYDEAAKIALYEKYAAMQIEPPIEYLSKE